MFVPFFSARDAMNATLLKLGLSRPAPPASAPARADASAGLPDTPRQPLRVDLVTAPDELFALADAWRTLQRRTPRALLSPFQDWDFVRAWLATACQTDDEGGECRPVMAVVRQGQRPILMLPFQLDRHAGLKRLTWLGMPALQYGGFLLDERLPADMRNEAMETALLGLASLQADFDDFRLMPADAPATSFLARSGWRGAPNASYCVDMSAHADWRAYELSLRRSTRRARHKRLNRLSRQGRLVFRMQETGPRRHELLDIALGWKRSWLAARGEGGSFAATGTFAQLMHAVLDHSATSPARWMAAELKLDGHPIAIEIGAAMHGVFFAYLAAYDVTLAEHSPGKVLMWLMLQWCKENGIDIYDMLPNHAPYKAEWANVMRPLVHVIRPRTVRGQAYGLWASRLRPLAREAYQALPPSLRGLIGANLRRLRDGGKGGGLAH